MVSTTQKPLRIGTCVWLKTRRGIVGARVIADDGSTLTVQIGHPPVAVEVFRSAIHREWNDANEAERPAPGQCPLADLEDA